MKFWCSRNTIPFLAHATVELCKNADSVGSVVLHLYYLICFATIGVCDFRCVDFGWRTFLFLGEKHNIEDFEGEMRKLSEYEMEEFWEDNDNQDGTFFEGYEKPYRKEKGNSGERDKEHEERKRRALLYIHAHLDALMKNEDYKTAYNRLIDASVREFHFSVYETRLETVSQEQRELEGAVLDFEILALEEKEIESYKEDAAYIVKWIKQGKRLIVYT